MRDLALGNRNTLFGFLPCPSACRLYSMQAKLLLPTYEQDGAMHFACPFLVAFSLGMGAESAIIDVNGDS